MKSTIRKKPRVFLNAPAVLSWGENAQVLCQIGNLSRDGMGLKVSTSTMKKLQKERPQKIFVLWSPVPTMKPMRWSLEIQRAAGDSIGARLRGQDAHPAQLCTLRKLIHFHLGEK